MFNKIQYFIIYNRTFALLLIYLENEIGYEFIDDYLFLCLRSMKFRFCEDTGFLFGDFSSPNVHNVPTIMPKNHHIFFILLLKIVKFKTKR